MTIFNTNPTELQVDNTLQQLGITLQSLNNHLQNLKPATKTLNSGDRYLARQEYADSQGDAVFAEFAFSGLGSLAGLDVLDSITNMTGGFGEALMEAAQDLHELDANNNMSDLEKAMRLRRRRAYEEEMRQERRVETETRKLKNMMTLMAMAVATLEERVKRREKRELKRSTMNAFKQNNQTIAQKKNIAGQTPILAINSNDIMMEAV